MNYNIMLRRSQTKQPNKKMQEEKKTSRQQLSKVININLSVSRVRKILDKENINVNIERAIAKLKNNSTDEETEALVQRAYKEIYESRKTQHDKLIASLKGKKDSASKKRLKELKPFPQRTGSVEEKTELVSKLRYRFSNDSSVALTSILDYVVQDLATMAIVNARSVYKSIIKVEHVMMKNLEDSKVSPLLRNLAVLTAVGETEENETEEVEESGSNFDFYVHEICKQVRADLIKQDENYKSIRISKEFRQFGSSVLIEIIERLSPLIQLYVENTNIKTINDEVIKFIIKFLYMDSRVDYEELFKFVDEKLELYKNRKAL